MVVKSLVTASTGSAFTQDTRITLLNYVKNNWPAGGAGGNPNLTADKIAFVTSMASAGAAAKLRTILFEDIVKESTVATLGPSRYRVRDVKRIQVIAKGHSAINEVWQMSEFIMSLLNANFDQLGNGVETVQITAFENIGNYSDATVGAGLGTSSLVSRAKATAELYYDLLVE